MNRRTKKDAQYGHARERAHDRLGVDLSIKNCKAIAKLISNGKAVLLANLFDGRKSYLVNFQGTEMRVIYAPKSKSLITIMPVYEREDMLSWFGD